MIDTLCQNLEEARGQDILTRLGVEPRWVAYP